MVEGGGFEPPKHTRQIYSLIPLATRVPLQKEALDSAFETCLCQTKFRRKAYSTAFYPISFDIDSVTDSGKHLAQIYPWCLARPAVSAAKTGPPLPIIRFVKTLVTNYGAATKSRTRDLLITNQLLYQLSYSGT